MKRITIVITILVLAISACQNGNGNTDQERIQELETELAQLSDSIAIEAQQAINDSIANNLKLIAEENEKREKEIDALKLKYKHVRAKYTETAEGDLFYYQFVDEKGKDRSFSYVKDKSYELTVDSDESNFGMGINPEYKNKSFDIFYQIEQHDMLCFDPYKTRVIF